MSKTPTHQSGATDVIWLKRQFISECAEILESLAISLREAAWRGSDFTIETTLFQQRETLMTAIIAFKELDAMNAKDVTSEKEVTA